VPDSLALAGPLRRLESSGGWPPAVTAARPPSPGVVRSSAVLFANRVAPSWTLDASPSRPSTRPLPRSTGPPHQMTRVHPAMDQIPFRVPGLLSTIRPLGRSRLPWSFLPPSTASSSEPHVERLVHSRSGSTLRLSQPLSGFPASSSSTALFRAATVPEGLPSELSPHKAGDPSRGPLLPRGHPPVCRAHRSRSFTAGFPDSHALDAVARFPRRLWAPFPCTRTVHVPVTLDLERQSRPFRQLHPPRSLAPPVNPFAPTRVTPRQRAAALLGFYPSREPFQTSDPRPAPTSK
jgi:hypothetical protein